MVETEQERMSLNIEGVDFISSTLPDASHLSIDQSHILKPLIQAYLRGLYLYTRLQMAFNRRRIDRDDEIF